MFSTTSPSNLTHTKSQPEESKNEMPETFKKILGYDTQPTDEVFILLILSYLTSLATKASEKESKPEITTGRISKRSQLLREVIFPFKINILLNINQTFLFFKNL